MFRAQINEFWFGGGILLWTLQGLVHNAETKAKISRPPISCSAVCSPSNLSHVASDYYLFHRFEVAVDGS